MKKTAPLYRIAGSYGREPCQVTPAQKLSLVKLNTEENFLLLDTRFKIITFSHSFQKVCSHFSQNIFEGDLILTRIPTHRVTLVESIFVKALSGCETNEEIELTLPDRSMQTYLAKVKPAFDKHRKIIGIFISIVNVTSSKELASIANKLPGWKNDKQQKEFDSNNLNALINNTNDLMWSVDRNLRLISFNKAFGDMMQHLMGKPLKTGSNIFTIGVDDDKLERWTEFYQRALSGESFTETEYINTQLQTWSEISFYPILHGDEVVGTACYSRNITETKKATQLLVKAYKENTTILESITDGFFIVNKEWLVMYWNKEAERIMGVPRLSIIGKNIWEAFPIAIDLKFYSETHKALARQAPQHFEEFFPPLGIWIDATAYPSEEGLSIFFKDITARKLADEKIRISEEKYRQIFYDNPFPMFLYDSETLRMLECNNAAVEKYGYSREEFLRLTISDIQPPVDTGPASVNAGDLQRADGNGDCIWRHAKKNGEMMMVEVFIYTIEYGDKKVKQAQINDITEKLKLNTELEESSMRQQRAVNKATILGQEKEREQLGIELHDNINQLLATAKLYLDFSMSDSEVKKDMLLKSNECISLATEEIRKLSHALLPPSLEEFGLGMALDELTHPVSVTGKIFIDKQWNDFPEQSLEKDQKLTIYRIVQEQLSNILKHAAAKKIIISLRLMDEGKAVELFIKDDGKGFDPVQKRNGVGLRNIISRAALFNGKVDIHSEPGRGCELSVIFSGNPTTHPTYNSYLEQNIY